MGVWEKRELGCEEWVMVQGSGLGSGLPNRVLQSCAAQSCETQLQAPVVVPLTRGQRSTMHCLWIDKGSNIGQSFELPLHLPHRQSPIRFWPEACSGTRANSMCMNVPRYTSLIAWRARTYIHPPFHLHRPPTTL